MPQRESDEDETEDEDRPELDFASDDHPRTCGCRKCDPDFYIAEKRDR